MKSARIHAFGGPETIVIDDLPTPTPGPGEVLIRIHASSVNPVDYKIRKGVILPATALPIALGRDMAGMVEHVGADVTAFGVGDEVFANLPMDRGGNAQFVALDPGLLARKPKSLDMVETGALGLAALTAWQGLFDHGGLVEGQRVLVHGAAGGVGHLAVQFARSCGGVVFATCGPGDLDFVAGLGAQRVIDYRSERFEDRAEAVDLVLDLVGGETQSRSWAVLKPGGTMISALSEPDKTQAGRLEATSARYAARPDGRQLAQIAELIDAGRIRPHVAQVLPLEALAQAHAILEGHHPRGKVVLRTP